MVILICGKICCGKTTYARRLCNEKKAALLSADEIMLSIFGLYAGERHDEYAAGVRRYLFRKAAELDALGVNTVLDWGFWTKDGRREARAFFADRGIPCALHYLDVDDETWRARVAKRNAAVLAGETEDYLVDDNLAAKFSARFEMPAPEEADVWVRG